MVDLVSKNLKNHSVILILRGDFSPEIDDIRKSGLEFQSCLAGAIAFRILGQAARSLIWQPLDWAFLLNPRGRRDHRTSSTGPVTGH